MSNDTDTRNDLQLDLVPFSDDVFTHIGGIKECIMVSYDMISLSDFPSMVHGLGWCQYNNGLMFKPRTQISLFFEWI